ncbi:MAG: universal stress protein [Actinobacteria bacterium]|nr:universal stress protein [Actinomycetota bacterium]MCB8996413.1 universal stress protein [Actinomycetota bacterium]HRY10414.1 universal stress protein [Candidatus Nanopelagicales bacterium]
MSEKMLFGDDGSTSADAAWLWVNSHDWPDWTIDVLRAVDGGPHVDFPRLLLRPQAAGAVNTLTVHEDPRYALHTRGRDYDLIVIGRKGRGVMKALHIGSTAEWLMHLPPAPTVIVHGGHRTKRILLAHDGSPDAIAAEQAVASLPWIGDVHVRLVSVSDGTSDAVAVTDAAVERLDGVAGELTVSVLRPDELQVFYRPRDIIMDAVDSWHPDLLAIGSRGMSRWESLNETALRRAGSTATALATHAPCSVLLAHHRD